MWIEKEAGWEVVWHSLMLGPSVPGPGPGGTIPWGGPLTIDDRSSASQCGLDVRTGAPRRGLLCQQLGFLRDM